MGICHGRYRYMRDLQDLNRCCPGPGAAPLWSKGPSPIRLPALIQFLRCHPDQEFAAYIFEGLAQGFRIGFRRQCALRGNFRNHPSTDQCPLAVTTRITSEVQRGCLVGPLPDDIIPSIHVNPIGLVPKPHADTFRMIVDLSAPRGLSVNDGIREDICSLCYASVDQAVSLILRLGQGTTLVKLDLKDAYRIVPVHPDDHPLLGISWEGLTYVDRSLPFGLRSAPKIFTAVADMLAWAIHCEGVRYVLHYLDDFLLLGSPGSSEAEQALSSALRTFNTLGVPVASHKTEGPSTHLSFLGILVDTDRFQLRLPADKLARLRLLVATWRSKRSCTRNELESLVGHLSHAAIVVQHGRIFLRPLFALLSSTARPHFLIRLNRSVRADFQWWDCCLQGWNGSFFFPPSNPSDHVYSDASGLFGCGAFDTRIGWFQFQWRNEWTDRSIATKELIPVVVAAALWGRSWEGRHVCFHSDNMTVVSIITKRSARDLHLLALLRCLFFLASFYKFHYSARYIPGVINTAADALSRMPITDFSPFVPQIPAHEVPGVVMDLLVHQIPDWICPAWTRQFRTSLLGDSPRRHEPPTGRA